MPSIIDVDALETISKEHSDNKRVLRRDDLKLSLVSVRPRNSIPVHSHQVEDQVYYVLEGKGTITLDGEPFDLYPGVSVEISPGVAHGVSNPFDTPLRYLDVFVDWGARRETR